MAMNSIADIEDYENFNFHYLNIYDQLRPLKLTTHNNVYSLSINEKGNRQYICDSSSGRPMASPRYIFFILLNLKIYLNINVAIKIPFDALCE